MVPKSKSCVLLFAKPPIKGTVKTRLAEDLGDEHALRIYKSLFSFVVRRVNDGDYDKIVYWAQPYSLKDSVLPKNFLAYIQQGTDLGERLKNACYHASLYYDKIIIIGSDCPFVSTELIEKALKALTQNPVVIGPTYDGGYYLIGMDQFYPQLFNKIAWSTNQVFSQTLDNIKKASLVGSILQTFYDIDTQNDWERFKHEQCFLF